MDTLDSRSLAAQAEGNMARSRHNERIPNGPLVIDGNDLIGSKSTGATGERFVVAPDEKGHSDQLNLMRQGGNTTLSFSVGSTQVEIVLTKEQMELLAQKANVWLDNPDQNVV